MSCFSVAITKYLEGDIAVMEEFVWVYGSRERRIHHHLRLKTTSLITLVTDMHSHIKIQPTGSI